MWSGFPSPYGSASAALEIIPVKARRDSEIVGFQPTSRVVVNTRDTIFHLVRSLDAYLLSPLV
jgi:hypothetical protein